MKNSTPLIAAYIGVFALGVLVAIFKPAQPEKVEKPTFGKTFERDRYPKSSTIKLDSTVSFYEYPRTAISETEFPFTIERTSDIVWQNVKPKKNALTAKTNGGYFGNTLTVDRSPNFTTGIRIMNSDTAYSLVTYRNDTLRINRSKLTWLNDSTAIFIKPR